MNDPVARSPRASELGAGEAVGEALRWRRRISLAVAVLAGLASLSAFVLEQLKGNPDWFERFGLPFIALLAGCIVLAHRSELGERLQFVLLAVCSSVLVERVWTVLFRGTPGLEPFLDTYEIMGWFPLVYLAAFVLMRTRFALLFCVVLVAGALAVVLLARAARPTLAMRQDVFELFISNVGCVFFIFVLSSLKERWAAAEALAATLRRFAMTDHLTGIPNRREASARVERELERSARYETPLALFLLDLDGFKRINDEFGHEMGDRALCRAAAAMLRLLRTTDICGRWGGEEFLVALPGVGLAGGEEAAERLRAELAKEAPPGEPPLRASFGVTERAPGDTLASIVRRADGALYEAKRRGRDRVERLAPIGAPASAGLAEA